MFLSPRGELAARQQGLLEVTADRRREEECVGQATHNPGLSQS